MILVAEKRNNYRFSGFSGEKTDIFRCSCPNGLKCEEKGEIHCVLRKTKWAEGVSAEYIREINDSDCLNSCTYHKSFCRRIFLNVIKLSQTRKEDDYMCMRVTDHIILGHDDTSKMIEITVDGKKIPAKEGEPILAALLAQDIMVNRYTVKRNEPRGLFCGIGQCTDCAMIVDGRPNVRTCITPAVEGMVVKTQHGYGTQEV